MYGLEGWSFQLFFFYYSRAIVTDPVGENRTSSVNVFDTFRSVDRSVQSRIRKTFVKLFVFVASKKRSFFCEQYSFYILFFIVGFCSVTFKAQYSYSYRVYYDILKIHSCNNPKT